MTIFVVDEPIEPGSVWWKVREARRYLKPYRTQEELSEELSVSRSLVGMIERGKRDPKDDLLRTLAIIGNFPVTWFSDGQPTPPPGAAHPLGEPPNIVAERRSDYLSGAMVAGRTVAIPVWRTVLAGGEDEEYFEDDSFESPKEFPSFYVLDHPELHVLCIASGRSMEPRINNRERALVRLDTDVGAGHLVVARNSEGRNYIKRLVRNSRERLLELHSINPVYPVIVDLDGWSIKGGVTMIQHDYEPGVPNIEWDEGRYLR